MPEIPDVNAIVAYLRTQILGATITDASLPLAWMLRNATADPAEQALRGETIDAVDRRGKHVLFSLRRTSLVINPMLVGRFYYQPPEAKPPRQTVMDLRLSTGKALRYADERQMGRLYLVPDRDYAKIPGFLEQGPEPLGEDFTFERFLDRLKGRYGEIKGLLTNAKVIAGIGNAYADEILFEAGIYPFRRKKDLSVEELRRVYDAIRSVLPRASRIVAERMGAQIHLKIRDFLAVHGKGEQPCPRCGQRIATIGRERATNFCRACQPGLMVAPQRSLPLGE
ncbi:MAG TPA: DNA-formamidopyrimidine glycosylase family protein [Nitrospiria bacterium]|nr:DNA-formamidopyrimidine glycosylase family protein [Nitrospiria bacterium]